MAEHTAQAGALLDGGVGISGVETIFGCLNAKVVCCARWLRCSVATTLRGHLYPNPSPSFPMGDASRGS